MRESAILDELDLLLVTALQTSPRADWQQIGRVLNVAATTAARRWERLRQAGLAWLTCHPLRLPGVSPLVALIEIDCAPGKLHSVATHVIEDPHVVTAAHVTGNHDLVVTAAFADHASLARYVGFRLGAMDGVTATRAQIVTALYADGSRWRLDRLDERHRGTLRPDRPAAAATRTDPDVADEALMAALGQDCRLAAADLAKRTGLSATSVRRRLARLEADKVIAFRCEVARFLSGWPVAVLLWGTVAPDRAAQVTAALVGMRETRMCASLAGPANLHISMWLRSTADIPDFEARLATRIPDLTIVDRAVVLWPLKIGGHILDPQGRHLRAVPISRWPDAEAAEAEAAVVRHLRGPRPT